MPFRFPLAPALAALPGAEGQRSVLVFEHGTLAAKVYAPRGSDPQEPHARDEIYVVAAGSGTFVSGGERVAFGPTDFLLRPPRLRRRTHRRGRRQLRFSGKTETLLAERSSLVSLFTVSTTPAAF
jgi:mannose-6-phosphate isomerase-like protein (cupin superfamily)